MQGVGVQRQLLVGTGGILLQRLTFGVADRKRSGKRRAGNDQQGIQRQTQGTGSRQHAGRRNKDGQAPYHEHCSGQESRRHLFIRQ
ncbi:hypothetical protein D3C81_2129340 [compost metagenome]